MGRGTKLERKIPRFAKLLELLRNEDFKGGGACQETSIHL